MVRLQSVAFVLIFLISLAIVIAHTDDADDFAEDQPLRKLNAPSQNNQDIPLDALDEDDDTPDPVDIEGDFDEDEFESLNTPPQNQPPVHRKDFEPRKPMSVWERYGMETVFVVLIFGYILNYIFRRSTNNKIVQAWLARAGPILEREFSWVGDGEGHALIKDSESEYRIYASGRRNCIAMTGSLRLKARYDLLYSLYDFFSPSPDKMIVQVEIDSESMEGYILAITSKLNEKSLMRYADDLNQFAGRVGTPKDFPANLCVIAETAELVEHVVSPQVLAMLKEYSTLITLIHITDRSGAPAKPKVINFEFNLPSTDKFDAVDDIFALVMHLMDLAPRVRLSPQARAKCNKRRAKAVEEETRRQHEERQEAAMKRKFDKLKEKKDDIMNLPRDQQRKAEEKLRKQELKNKRKVLRVVS